MQSRGRSDLRHTLKALPHLLDSEFGVIQSIEYYKARYDDPQFVHCHAIMADISRVTGRFCNLSTGGTALTKDVALAKAIGESVERYCSDICDVDDVLLVPYRDIMRDAIDPRRFVLFHPDQYREPGFQFAQVTDNTIIGWVQGFSLTRNEPTLVPASQVHQTYRPRSQDEFFESNPVSGYACGNTIEEAILGGICEVIERDSFMIFWYNMLPAPAIDLSSFASEEVRQSLDRYHCAPVSIFCTDITTDTEVPAALAVMTSRKAGWPAAIVATAADLNMERAITRALQELAANHLFIRATMESGQRPVPLTAAEVRDQEDHGLFYVSPERLRNLDVVLRPRWVRGAKDFQPRATDDLKENIEACVRQLAKLDLEVVVVELTTPDINELGLRVVKVLIPGMQPIDFGAHWPHLGGPRVYESPVRMGYRTTPAQPWELNLSPHPFP